MKKSDKLSNVGQSTVYITDESEEYEEEVAGIVLGGGGEDDIIVPVEYSRWMVGSFLSVGSSYIPSLHFFLYISEHARLNSISRIRDGGNEN